MRLLAVVSCLGSGNVSAAGLAGTADPAGAAIDLTAGNPADWAHWGLVNADSFNQRSGGAGQISDYSPIGGAVPARGSSQATSYTWSDGAPTGSVVASKTGLRVFFADKGFSLSVPADTQTRTLTVYVGVRLGVGELTATLSDGSAASYTVQVSDLAGKSGFAVTLDYSADSAGQTLDVAYVLKSEVSGANGWASLDAAVLVGATGGGVGSLSGTESVAAAQIDLTALGTDDWVHWAFTDAGSFEHKAGVTSQISDYSPVDGASPVRANNLVAAYSWTDGTPVASASSTRSGLKAFSVGKGYSFTVPAEIAPRELDVYVGINRGVGELTATLSDASAAPFVVELSQPSGKASYRVRLNYAAATAGQTLNVSYVLKSETNAVAAWASLESATLVGSGGANSPPVIVPIGNQSITEGDTFALGVSATDVDGGTPLVLSQTSTLPGAPAILTDNGDGTGVINWQSVLGDAAGSPYSVTLRATDSGGAFTEETFAIVVNPTGGPSLSGSQQLASNTVDLTALGADDWAHWGLATATSFDHKAGVPSQISDYTMLSGSILNRAANIVARYSWADGSPTATATNSRTGLKVFNVDGGFAFNVPADTNSRTLQVYVGVNRGVGELVATLSDGSAAPYSVQLLQASGKASYVATIVYAAATDGQQLDVTYSLKSKASTAAWASLESAALTESTPSNAAPIFSPIGDRSVTEGQQLLIAVGASDSDGPAPITLSETNTLPGSPSILTDTGGGVGELNWTASLGDAAGSPYSVTVRATDGLGAYTEQTLIITVLPVGAGGGSLSGVAVPAPASVNLSTVGTLDWAHWGLSDADSFDTRLNGGGLISDFAPLGGANPARGSSQPSKYSWSDGTPTTSATATDTGVRVFAENKGFRVTVPADEAPRTLFVYVGVRSGIGELTASLSDGSSADLVLAVESIDKASFVATISYSAASNGETLTLDYVLASQTSPGTVWAALESLALADGAGIQLPYVEDFSAGAPNWLTVDDTFASSAWQTAGGVYQQSNAMGYTADALRGSSHIGTYSYLSTGTALTDYTLSVTATVTANSAQDIGVMLRLNPASDDYLRLSFSGAGGFSRLERASAGALTSLTKNARGVFPNVPLGIEVHVSGPAIIAYLDGQQLFAAYDENLTAGTVGLYCRDACEFDDLLIDSLPSEPVLAIASPTAWSVSASTSIDVSAVVMNAPAGATVEFDIPGESNPCGAAIESSPSLFTATCAVGADGLYTLDAQLLSATSTVLASSSRSNVGVGDNYVALGDSLTAGVDDSTSGDGSSANGFVQGVQGYEGLLTDRLADAGDTAVVFNNGFPGDKSSHIAQDRIVGVLQRHEDSTHVLLTVGVNDAGGAAFTASGLGCSGASCDGTFAGYVQDIVDAAVLAGKTVVVALTPPRFGDPLQAPHSAPETHAQNLRINDEYNEVIRTQIDDIVVGPDFFDFFLGAENRFYLYETNLHPNALGYQAMAILFDQALTSNASVLFFATNLCVRSATGAPCESPLTYKQTLIETGNHVYVDESFALTGSVPASLDDGRWIQTADADRSQANVDYLSFDLPSVADVYVAYDDAAASLPAWLSSYTDTGQTVSTTNPAAPLLRLYLLSDAVGTVTLGGADAAATAAGANYLVVIVD